MTPSKPDWKSCALATALTALVLGGCGDDSGVGTYPEVEPTLQFSVTADTTRFGEVPLRLKAQVDRGNFDFSGLDIDYNGDGKVDSTFTTSSVDFLHTFVNDGVSAKTIRLEANARFSDHSDLSAEGFQTISPYEILKARILHVIDHGEIPGVEVVAGNASGITDASGRVSLISTKRINEISLQKDGYLPSVTFKAYANMIPGEMKSAFEKSYDDMRNGQDWKSAFAVRLAQIDRDELIFTLIPESYNGIDITEGFRDIILHGSRGSFRPTQRWMSQIDSVYIDARDLTEEIVQNITTVVMNDLNRATSGYLPNISDAEHVIVADAPFSRESYKGFMILGRFGTSFYSLPPRVPAIRANIWEVIPVGIDSFTPRHILHEIMHLLGHQGHGYADNSIMGGGRTFQEADICMSAIIYHRPPNTDPDSAGADKAQEPQVTILDYLQQ